MQIAIMQPYFFPYIGYFQLINAVDEFVVYDNIEFTKKGWFNRNRILVNGSDSYITAPVKKDSDYLHVRDRQLAEVWPEERKKMLNRIKESYQKAPNFTSVFPMLQDAINIPEANLFKFLHSTIQSVNSFLEINTRITVASAIGIDHALKSEDKVLEICKDRGATKYLNSSGGKELYSVDRFRSNGIQLNFLKSNNLQYKQFNGDHVPFLSIIDVLMFNSKQEVQSALQAYSIE